MVEVEEALERMLAVARPLGGETAPLSGAAGRILAAPVTAPIDLPPFDNSAMDGYAVHAQDLQTAGPESPVRLSVRGRVAAGAHFDRAVRAGTCVRIFTGSPLPEGADAVLMQEDTRPDGANADTILCLDRVKPWENVRLRGEDVKRGQTLLDAGVRLTAGRISLLAAAGLEQVSVGRRPRAALLATGSELREPGQPLGPGQIYESNRPGLSLLLARAGAVPQPFPLVADTLEDTRTALEQALGESDVVVSSGGVSVGEFDFVKTAFEQLGGGLDLRQVRMKPGKPFVFGRRGDKLFFGLPGNPVSAFVTAVVLVLPVLLRLQGAADVSPARGQGALAEAIVNRGDRRHFVRVRTDAAGRLHLAGTQASHVLSSLAAADGLVDVPPHATFEAGQQLRYLRLE